jgi:diguanylate cyclase (GGDEF)-like protein
MQVIAMNPSRSSAGEALLRIAPRPLARRPAIAWSLSLLFLFKGLVCLSTVVFPVSAQEPTGLVAVTGLLAIVAASGVWLLGLRIPMLGYELLAAGGSLTTSWVVSHAATQGGMMITAFAYPWIAIYAAHFFPRRGVIVQGLIISVGFGAGLLLGGMSNVVIYWIIVTVTIWSICLVLGHLSEALRRQADTDPLTGLLNRSGFLVAAKREHAISQRTGSPLTLVVIDLDGFKQINDLRGHLVGDHLLTELGRSWRARLRAGDILARHGGDEFLLLLPSTSPDGASVVLDRLHVEEMPITWSVGIGEWLEGESLSDCLARADADLYTVKNALRVRDAREIVPLLVSP